MTISEKLKFTLSPGTWHYWFKDKESGRPLTCRQAYLIKNDYITSEVAIMIPDEVKNNVNAIIHIQRVR